MILTCPECATSYFVDDSRVSSAGRTVKCSNCGAKWTARPEGADESAAPAAPPPARPAPAATPAPAADDLVVDGPEAPAPAETPIVSPKPAKPARPRPEGRVLVLAVAAGLIVALVAGVLVFRGPIVRLWPASGVAYRSLGVPVNDVGLMIEGVKAEPAFQGGRPVLSVTGQIRNIHDAAATAPALRVSLLDAKGKSLAAKVAQPINGQVPGKMSLYFAIAIVDPPANVHDLEVVFEPAPKGAKPVHAGAAMPASRASPQPDEAKPLPPGSPDALPAHHD